MNDMSVQISNEIIKKFFRVSKIKETPNHSVEGIMVELTRPESIASMILMSELGKPALAGVVSHLEDMYGYSDFPLHRDAPDHNAPNRRNVGWMIKFIMREFGYVPVCKETVDGPKSTDNSKCQNSTGRISTFGGSKWFSSSSCYERKGPANYDFNVELYRKNQP